MNKETKTKNLFPQSNYSLKILNRIELIPIGKVYCIGRNYAEHAIEMNESPETNEPFFFSKPPQSLTQIKIIKYPANTKNLHHEVELAVIIGSKCKNVSSRNAHKNILGYSVGIDLTKRDLQQIAKDNRKPWDLSKGFDNSAPISLVNIKEGEVIKKGKIELKINGVIKQTGDIAQMIYPVNEIIAYLSNYITLHPGDVIFTGTPSGVGKVEVNDKLEASIEGIGKLEVLFTD